MTLKRRLNKNVSAENEMFADKSYADYQKMPDFPEIVAILSKFEKVLKMKIVSFAELEQALDLENENNGRIMFEWTRSDFLTKMYSDILAFLGHSVKDLNSNELHSSIFALLNKWKDELPISSDILKASDMCELSTIQKLNVINLMLNQALNSDRARRVIETLDVEDLRIQPFLVDKNGNKLWYFSDTYLFLESNDLYVEPPLKKSNRRKSTVTAGIGDNLSLFTGNSFKIICRTSDDWLQLIEAYKKKHDKNTVDYLARKYECIRSLEQKRLKEELRLTATVRTSSRIQLKIEQRKEKEEVEKRQKEEERIRRDATIKQLLLERQHTSAEQQKVINEVLLERREEFAASREERRLQREQRKLQHLSEKEQLIFKPTNVDCNGEVSCSKQYVQPVSNSSSNTDFCDDQNLKAARKKEEESNDWFELCKINKQNDTFNHEQRERLLDQYLKPSSQSHSKDRCHDIKNVLPANKNSQQSVCSKFPKTIVAEGNNGLNICNKSIFNNTQVVRSPNIIVKRSFPSVTAPTHQASSNCSIITSSRLTSEPKIIMPSPKPNITPPVYCLDRYGQLQRVVAKPNNNILNFTPKHLNLPSRENNVIYDGIYNNVNECDNYVTASSTHIDNSQYPNRFTNMRPNINGNDRQLNEHQTYHRRHY